MTGKNRAVALLLALTIVFVMLFSFCYTFAEANHTCVGEDCPICCLMDVCAHILRSIGLTAVSVVCALGLSARALSVSFRADKPRDTVSPVVLRVKLTA